MRTLISLCSILLCFVSVIGMDLYSPVVTFHLYTKDTSGVDQSQTLYVNDTYTLKSSLYNFTLPTKVLIHGFLSDYKKEFTQDIKDEFFRNGEYNIIGVDWFSITESGLYYWAKILTKPVGEYVAEFIDFLVDSGAQLNDFHVIGHSLGAHVAGFCGKSLRSGQLPRITGLDPALPLFPLDHPDKRLSSSDALYVDCIHTCGGFLGFKENICKADFYPNGGTDPQPGCPPYIEIGVCSHKRAVAYFAESINKSHKFLTFECPTVPTDKGPVGCSHSDELMGYPAKSSGIYFSYTKGYSPYAFFIDE